MAAFHGYSGATKFQEPTRKGREVTGKKLVALKLARYEHTLADYQRPSMVAYWTATPELAAEYEFMITAWTATIGELRSQLG